MLYNSAASPWLAVPVGFLLSALGVFVLEPALVDAISSGVLSLDGSTPSVAMLWLDLLLGTTTLTLSLYGVAWWSRRPKVISMSLVALLVLAAVFALVFSPSADLPDWYRWASGLSVIVAWIWSGFLFNMAGSNNPIPDR